MEAQKTDNIWQYVRPWFRWSKRYLEALSYPLFNLKGKVPHSFGYPQYKQNEIKNYINNHEFKNIANKINYGYKIDERIVEFPWLLSLLPDKPGTLLDAGSALNHRFLLKNKLLLNKDISISTLSPESDAWWRRGVSYVYEDFRFSRFRDEFFDWITCISTLEHVGLDNTLLYTGDLSKKENSVGDTNLAIREFRRMLRPGGKLYLTFPYGKHRNYGWFQIFDAEMVESLALAFQPKHRNDSYFKYTKNGWKPATKEELVDADSVDSQSKESIISSLDGAAGARGLACLEWTR